MSRIHATPNGNTLRPQRGLTLVEIMVAMTLSLILLAGITQIYLSSKQTYRVVEANSRIQENGRIALNFFAQDIRMADFWGCANFNNVTNNLNSAGAGYIDFGTGGVVGTEGGGLTPDSIVLRGGVGTGLQVQPPYGPQASGDIKVTSPNHLAPDDIVFISDCTAGDIFQITSGNPGNNGTVVHNTGTASPGNGNPNNPGCPGANAHCLSKVYLGDATLYSAREVRYFIQNSADTGQPALFRTQDGVSQELVDGIENLQFLYGEDTDATPDFVANRYLPANQVVDMDNVVSIRVDVVGVSYTYEGSLTTSPQPYTLNGATQTPADNRLRQIFSTTVTLRNRVK